jgi:hypothetical protein
MKIFAKIIHYLARTLAILFAIFLAAFILEGFDPAFGWQSGAMHAVIAGFAFALAVVAHKRPKLGGILYISFGLGFLAMMLLTSPMAQASSDRFVQLLITMTPLNVFTSSIGIMFLLDAWLTGRQKKAEKKEG